MIDPANAADTNEDRQHDQNSREAPEPTHHKRIFAHQESTFVESLFLPVLPPFQSIYGNVLQNGAHFFHGVQAVIAVSVANVVYMWGLERMLVPTLRLARTWPVAYIL